MKRRCWVIEYKGDNKAVFGCPEGHTFRASLFKRKPRGVGEGGLQMMAKWWSKERGGVSMECPKCRKISNSK